MFYKRYNVQNDFCSLSLSAAFHRSVIAAVGRDTCISRMCRTLKFSQTFCYYQASRRVRVPYSQPILQ